MPRSRPNILFVITDQQRYETVNALGYEYMDTPVQDRLVREGVSFSGCHVNAPSCGPSRGALFSGLSPHNSGALMNQQTWPRTWVKDLSDSGYHCVNVGKMHAWPFWGMHGFNERFVVENKQRHFAERVWTGNNLTFFDEWDKALWQAGTRRLERDDLKECPEFETSDGAYDWWEEDDLHPDVFVGDMAIRWLENFPENDKPIFLEVGFPGPHPPFDPIKRYADAYMEKDLPMLEVSEEEMEAQPEALKKFRDYQQIRFPDSIFFDPHAPSERRHRQRAYYLANVTMIDEKLGQILETIEKRWSLDDWVIIFTSDHGEHLGDHGIVEKWTMYDCSVRVPLMFSAPGRIEGGRHIDDLVQLFDIGPTILDFAGVETPEHFEAQSLMGLLRDEPGASGREYVFSEHGPDPMLHMVEYEMMVRDKDWKLVEFLGEEDGQLYDLRSDPDEVINLWHDPDHAEQKAHLREVLHRWFLRSTVRTTASRVPAINP